ncbi:alpha/beta hydrolase [Halomonas aquatica]|uniref:Alpha/beta hydrolase n=1 Tax=Halomonas aquatica TaxID=3151123 RepID=A0ABV1NE82_9GAMM
MGRRAAGGWRGLLLCFPLLGLPLLVAGCATHLSTSDAPAVTQSVARPDVDFRRLSPRPYTPPDWPEALEARVLIPDTPSDARRPVALLVHGGGWQRRSPDDMTEIAERLARRGYVTINVAYRFAPEYRFPAQLEDLRQAMAWIHEQADDWRIDTERIVGVGYSSGAHLVSLLALSDEGGLAAVLAGGLPSDLLKFDDGRLVVEFIGGTRAEKPRAYRQASPIYHVHASAPPHFLFHGRWDGLVPMDHATDFHAALVAQGVESELYLQHYRGHFTSFLLRDSAIEAGIAFLDMQLEAQHQARQ